MTASLGFGKTLTRIQAKKISDLKTPKRCQDMQETSASKKSKKPNQQNMGKIVKSLHYLCTISFV